jgi:hypothetical protein
MYDCPFGWKNQFLKEPFPSAGGQGNKHPSTSTSLVLENLPYIPTIWALSVFTTSNQVFFFFFPQILFFQNYGIFFKKFRIYSKEKKIANLFVITVQNFVERICTP